MLSIFRRAACRGGVALDGWRDSNRIVSTGWPALLLWRKRAWELGKALRIGLGAAIAPWAGLHLFMRSIRSRGRGKWKTFLGGLLMAASVDACLSRAAQGLCARSV